MAEQTIKLSYNPDEDIFTSDPATVSLHEGDTLLFLSDQGPVNVKFDPPEYFAPMRVSDGTVQVRVVKRAPARMPCGITFRGGTIGFPLHERFGPGTEPAS